MEIHTRNRKGMDQYIDRLLAGIKSAGHEVQALVLRDMKNQAMYRLL